MWKAVCDISLSSLTWFIASVTIIIKEIKLVVTEHDNVNILTIYSGGQNIVHNTIHLNNIIPETNTLFQ